MTDTNPQTAKIRDQNDLFRAAKMGGRHTDLRGSIVYTQGVDSLSDEAKQAVFQNVREFSDFTEDNDPHGEHDFGAFSHNGDKFFWKIDYYAHDMMHGSENPADPDQTHRVLTIMLASEY